MWCWRRLLRVLWTARRSNESILKEISPEDSLEGLMLKLKLQYFGHLMQRMTHWKRPWCWERLKAGGGGDDRGWDDWMASPTQWTWIWVNSGSWQWTGRPGMLQSMGLQRDEWVTELNWTELKNEEVYFLVLISKSRYIFRSRNIQQDRNDKNHCGSNFAKYTLLTLFICKLHNYHDTYNLSITSMHNIPNYSSYSSTQYSELCDPRQMERSQKSQSFLQ